MGERHTLPLAQNHRHLFWPDRRPLTGGAQLCSALSTNKLRPVLWALC